MRIVLNSSKQPQAPACASPMMRLPTELPVICLPQLNTYTGMPMPLPVSLVVSVLPVPAEPWVTPPMMSESAYASVI